MYDCNGRAGIYAAFYNEYNTPLQFGIAEVRFYVWLTHSGTGTTYSGSPSLGSRIHANVLTLDSDIFMNQDAEIWTSQAQVQPYFAIKLDTFSTGAMIKVVTVVMNSDSNWAEAG